MSIGANGLKLQTQRASKVNEQYAKLLFLDYTFLFNVFFPASTLYIGRFWSKSQLSLLCREPQKTHPTFC